MITATLDWVAEKVDGSLQGDNTIITSVSTDTRDMAVGDLFFALSGPHFNGHDYLPEAKRKGAAAAVVEKWTEIAIPQILVADCKLALGRLGAAVKAEVQPLTVAITGSCGKTTVKEMVAAILSGCGRVLATEGNFNNDIGVPLTLLRLQQDHDFAVVEMGANGEGEIAYTCALTDPDVATIVNAEASHIEGFGSLLGVARAKSEIFKGLRDTGRALLNQDSQFYQLWQGTAAHVTQQTFGVTTAADFCATDVALTAAGCGQFQLCTPQGTVAVVLPLPGLHNVSNAIVAAGLALSVGADLEDVKRGLEQMQHIPGRLQIKQLSDQIRLIDDTYNANVASVNAAVDLLSSFAGQRLLVLGDMAELGEKTRNYHEQVGKHAKQSGIDRIYTLGVLSQHSSDIFEARGRHFTDVDTLVGALTSDLQPAQSAISILVKGSRGAKMERVVAVLEQVLADEYNSQQERASC